MKKICIVTWFTSPNYGTQLQATALYKCLSANGFHVCFLKKFNVLPYYLKHPGLLINRIQTKLNVKKSRAFFEPVPYKINDRRLEKINRYVADNFNVISIDNTAKWQEVIRENYAFVSGSDIIWQPNLGRPGRFFLDFAMYENLTRVSYASSTGAKILPAEFIKDYKRILGGFKAISVRESITAGCFSDILGRRVEKVIDPTLLLDAEDWDTYSSKAEFSVTIPKRYILCYFVMDDERYWKYVDIIKATTDLGVVVLPMHYRDENTEYTVIDDASVYEFLHLVKNAEFIVTDSFHAAVFSFQYEKEFYVLPRKRKDEDEKFSDLVEKYYLQHRLIKDESVFVRNTDTDYSRGKRALEEDRKKACAFLESALN